MCSISTAPAPMNSNCPCPVNSTDGGKYLLPAELRKVWENWDLRILVLYILFIQLALHLLGRRRKVSNTRTLIRLIAWSLYLFADLFATIALGKLSKINSGDDPKPNGGDSINAVSLLRGLWAPIILFYLGGPDTLTVLKSEENEMWSKHLVGLLTQGFRTTYVLFITWARSRLSLLALLMLFPGIIKYAERVWVMKSRARGKYEGFVRLDESPSARRVKGVNNSTVARPNADLVLKASSNFQILKPHLPRFACDNTKLRNLIKDFHTRIRGDVHDNFTLIEIELGFMYDVLFSKVGTIFTVWGCILRFVSFSCIVGVFVGFLLAEKPGGKHLEVDLPISIMLLVGAILLEVAGVVDQLVSDWGVAWAFKYRNMLSRTPVFTLQEFVLSRRKRWSGLMGQFSLLNFCKKYKLTKFNEMMEDLCGKEKWLDMKFSSESSEVDDTLKELIKDQLIETLPSLSDIEALQTSGMKRVERSHEKCGCLQEFEWSIELEFSERIVVWHIATDICYHSEDPNSVSGDPAAAKMLSYYMMHLLLKCPSRLPICKTNDKCFEVLADLKIFDLGPISHNAEACKQLLEEKETDSSTVKHIKRLARDLIENGNKWKIVSNVWVEMLCYAASRCPVKNHVQELRHGGEFLTHVWLLLMHFGVNKELEQDKFDALQATAEDAARKVGETFADPL